MTSAATRTEIIAWSAFLAFVGICGGLLVWAAVDGMKGRGCRFLILVSPPRAHRHE